MNPGAAGARTPALAAVAAGCWLLVYIPPTQAWVWFALVTSVVGVALLARMPLAGAALVLVASVVCALSGVPFGEIELFLAKVFVLFTLGRYQPSWVPGALFVLGLAASTSVRDGAPWYGLFVTAAVYSAPWVFGVVIRRRDRAAAAAADEAARLAGIDLALVMDNSARESRRNASRESLRVLQSSVELMCRLTRSARRTGNVTVLEEVRAEATRAIGELHHILMLLGPQSTPVADLPVRSGGRTDQPAEQTWGPQSVLLALAGAFVSLLVVYLGAGWQWRLVLLAVVVPVAAFLARRHVVVAGVAVGTAFAVAAFGPAFNHWVLLPIELCLAAFVWIAIAQRSLEGLIGFLVTFAGVLAMGVQFGKQGFGFGLVSVVLTVVASRAWREKDERLQAALHATARHTADIATAALQADRDERHRLARELHDGVSHGITAMTMQVQAAQVAGDPERSDHYLALALSAGEATLQEIASITSGWSRVGVPYGSEDDLAGLVEGARDLGVNITHHRLGETSDPLVFHVVREALTNIVRYAPGARVLVETGCRDGVCAVRVVDTGRVRNLEVPGNPLPGMGTGLRGLSARVDEKGGTFDAGSKAGGFEVRASWPCASVPETVVTADPADREDPAGEDVPILDDVPAPIKNGVLPTPVVTFLSRTDERPLEAV